MARFAVLTDENVDGPIVSALVHAGWDVRRAVDVAGERSRDRSLLELVAKNGWALATTDVDHLGLVATWPRASGRPRVVFWRNDLQQRLRPGAWVQAFEALAAHEDPFRKSPLCSSGWQVPDRAGTDGRSATLAVERSPPAPHLCGAQCRPTVRTRS